MEPIWSPAWRRLPTNSRTAVPPRSSSTSGSTRDAASALPIGHRAQILQIAREALEQRRPRIRRRGGSRSGLHDDATVARDLASRTTGSGSIQTVAPAARPPRPGQSRAIERAAPRRNAHASQTQPGNGTSLRITRADLSTRPARGASRMTDQRSPPTSCACSSSTITRSSARASSRCSTGARASRSSPRPAPSPKRSTRRAATSPTSS